MTLVLSYCASKESSPSSPGPDGEKIAQAVCASCHLLPDPKALDKKSWEEYVLPRMGYFLGIYPDSVSRESLIEAGPAEARLLADEVFPETAKLDSAQWQSIVNYYLSNAPEKPIQGTVLDIQPTEQFKAIRPAFQLQPPSVTMLRFAKEDKGLWLGDAYTGGFYAFDERLQPAGSARTTESPVWMSEHDDHFLITVMGSFSPTDAPSGMLLRLPKSAEEQPQPMISGLQRPVHHSLADLDGDGLEDLIICEFAKWTGSLSWWKNQGDGTYERRLLKKEPGSIKAYPKDWNNDGLMDIVALFAQGNEGIWAFLNNGDGTFTEEAVLRFPASWGSSYFALHDLDQDGDEDIIHCAGDNADFPPILKHYHGIRLYFNDGEQRFGEPEFIPLNGAYGAIPHDFDGDGDMDVAAISFFPDFTNHPEEGFVYLENTGDWNFSASTFPEVGAGRWIVMDAGDIDQDGDVDLALASLAFEVPGREDLVGQWMQQGIPFVLLENKLNP